MKNTLLHARFNLVWALRNILATAPEIRKVTIKKHTRREKIDTITLLAVSLLQVVPLRVVVVVDAKWSSAWSASSPDLFYDCWL